MKKTLPKELRNQAKLMTLDHGQDDARRLLRDAADELERLKLQRDDARAAVKTLADERDKLSGEVDRLRRLRPDPREKGIRIMVELTIDGETVGSPAFISESLAMHLQTSQNLAADSLRREILDHARNAASNALTFYFRRKAIRR